MLRSPSRFSIITFSLLLSTATIALAQENTQKNADSSAIGNTPDATSAAKDTATGLKSGGPQPALSTAKGNPAKLRSSSVQATDKLSPPKAQTPPPAPQNDVAAAKAATKEGAAATGDSGDSEKTLPLKRIGWTFEGMTGYVDKQAAQRGFYVYKQVCSACHSMNLVAYRSLQSLGFSEAEVKALAAEKQVSDINDKGESVMRPGKPSDHIVPPYPNEDASRAANGGAYPPDLSLIIKAREGGPNYVYSILTGFSPAPAGETPVPNKYYNPYFPNHWISMPPPLSEGVLTYQDGTPATVDQMARDVVNYLQWAAEPEMEQRHQMGLKVLMYLIITCGFLYIAKKRIWRKIGH